jgi:hypothetical protein
LVRGTMAVAATASVPLAAVAPLSPPLRRGASNLGAGRVAQRQYKTMS